ncbi:MAG TPA: 6,7-dimethyl-8-ribityllumazine synthase [Nitrospiria bacterium]
MVKVFEGDPKGSGRRIGIIVSKFNEPVTGKLLEGALGSLKNCGVDERDILVVKVPGAFEIPLAAHRLALSGKFDGLLCLGAVIQGETPHFEYISREVTRGVSRVMIESGIPVGFGVLTTETSEQAVERADPNGYNRGGEAARVVLEMADLFKGFPA